MAYVNIIPNLSLSISGIISNAFLLTVDLIFLSAVADTINPFNINAAVEEVEAIRKALDLPKFILVGHSIFGLIVLEYAQHYPQRISHVIAIGTMPDISQNRTMLAKTHPGPPPFSTG